MTRRNKKVERRPVPAWLTFGTGVAACSLMLALMGYGWTWGYLQEFGMGPAGVFGSPLDYLLASDEPITKLLQFGGDAVAMGIPGLLHFWARQGPLVFVVLFLILWLAFAGLAAWKGDQTTRAIFVPAWLVSLGRWGGGWMGASTAKLRTALMSGHRFGALKGLVFTAAVTAASPLLVFLSVGLAVGVPAALIALVPLVCAFMGQDDAESAVLKQDYCASPRGTRPTTKGALCVRVIKGQCEVVRGRFIAENDKRMWLLVKSREAEAPKGVAPGDAPHTAGEVSKTPRDWTVVSVPLDGAIVEDVREEVLSPAQPATCEDETK